MILLIDLGFEKNSLCTLEFVKPIEKIISENTQIAHYTQVTREVLDKADKVILCGTLLKDNVFRQDIEKFSWLKEFYKPVLGICAGFQIIGMSFGASLVKKKEIGMTLINVVPNALLQETCEVYSLHDSSLDNLENFEILARSKDCVQMIKHKTLPFYGVAFHPEVRRESVVKRFVELDF